MTTIVTTRCLEELTSCFPDDTVPERSKAVNERSSRILTCCKSIVYILSHFMVLLLPYRVSLRRRSHLKVFKGSFLGYKQRCALVLMGEHSSVEVYIELFRGSPKGTAEKPNQWRAEFGHFEKAVKTKVIASAVLFFSSPDQSGFKKNENGGQTLYSKAIFKCLRCKKKKKRKKALVCDFSPKKTPSCLTAA